MYEEKIKLEREYQKKLTLLKDNEKFIQTLEKSLDENYESFTPWKIYHESHKKIDSLGEDQKLIESEVRTLKTEIGKMNGFIKEIEGVLEVARSEKQESLKIEDGSLIEKTEVASDLELLRQKILSCLNYMNVDFMRCRLEIQSLYKLSEAMVNKYLGIADAHSLSSESSGSNSTDSTIQFENSSGGDDSDFTDRDNSNESDNRNTGDFTLNQYEEFFS